MSSEHWSKKLVNINACEEAIEWASTQSTYEEAWQNCERADWLLFLAGRLCDQKQVVLAACACARTTLKFVPEGENRPRICIETTEAWVRGEASIEQVKAVRKDAYASAYASAAYAAYAAYAVASAADAAHAVAYAAHAAAYAADAAYVATSAADAAHKSAHLEMCDIIRGMFSRPELV